MPDKPILIQGAMDSEIQYFLNKMSQRTEINLHGYLFYKGEIDGINVVVSKTQIGLINATASTILGILHFSPCLIINQGLAGGGNKEVHTGNIIIGETCININSFETPYRNENAGSNSLDWELKTFKEGIDELVVLKADENLLKIAKQEAESQNIDYKIGCIGSGDAWDNELDRILWFSNNYNILCEDMESIAVYSICEKFDVPVLGLRIISDNCLLHEEYDKTVSKSLQEFILHLIKNRLQY